MSQASTAVMNGKNERSSMSVKDITFTAMFAVIIAVCSWISIPMNVPFTLQTFAVFFAMLMLGGKRGTLSVLVYLLLGAVGAPVFAGFSSGISVILGSTGGYIIGFILIGLLYIAAELIFKDKMNIVISSAVLIVGLLMCYAFGTAWFMHIYTRTKGSITLMEALKWCVIPFILPDLAKLALALLISDRVRKHVRI